jgi:hypothetical protein
VDGQKEESWKEALRLYVLNHDAELDFTRHFWKRCEPLPLDIKRYEKFVQVVKLTQCGAAAPKVSEMLGVNGSSVHGWKHLSQMPKLGHLLKALLVLGPTVEGRVWLTLERSHGHAIPRGQSIQVPTLVTS